MMGALENMNHWRRRVMPHWANELMRNALFWGQTLKPLYRFRFDGAPAIAARSPFARPVAEGNLLEMLGEQYLPSKRLHNYLMYYWLHFRDVHLCARRVLEIGVQTDKSIRMWEEFFPNATIYGIDIDPRCREFAGGRRKVMIGDQSDTAFLQSVVDDAGEPFDIVIDDGSHIVDHQLKSFDYLFPRMSEHGIYVVEDTGGCVADYRLRTVNSLKTLVDGIMYWPDGFDPRDWPYLDRLPAEAGWAARHVTGIAFYRWLVFINRGRNPEDNPHLSPRPG